MSGNTPLPWHQGEEGSSFPLIHSNGIVVANCENPILGPNEEAANAALIVRAVNSHSQFLSALEQAEETLDQILDDMRDGGQCVCLAVKQEAIETLGQVRAALKAAQDLPNPPASPE